MDYARALGELHAERQRLTQMIATLEGGLNKQRERRGRRNMPPSERQQVSERMKVYWAARRSQTESRT